ncbi:MAG: hypothetical protein KF708_16320 [Pirellulales bacterium]|nr:hypothetical protein [Pirellulales bacterium]
MLTRNIERLGGYARAAVAGWHVRRSATPEEQRLAERHLVERLGHLRGLPAKVGQLLQLSLDSPVSSDDDLSRTPMPLDLATVRDMLTAAWQQPLAAVVRQISPAARTASLGQVHRATLVDGREVAIKVQYPGMRDALRMDLNLLGWLSLPAPRKQHGFDLPGYQAAILDDMERELDYRHEAENQRHFRAWAADDPMLVVPELIEELCTSNVLVARWEDGCELAEVQALWPEPERQQLAHALSRVFHEGFFERRLLHADWHPGNFRFRRGNQGVKVVLYDFGCVYEPTLAERSTLLRLIRATIDESESPYPLLLALGFRPEFLEPIEHKLPALCKVLFAPYAAPYPFALDDWQLSERFHDILGEDRWNFRLAGPPALIFLVRAFHGLVSFLRSLRVTTSWHHLLLPLLKRHREELDRLALPQPARPASTFGGLARHLKLRVQAQGRTKVQLTYPASVIDHLDEIIDARVQELIVRRGVDLRTLVTQVRQRAYAPGDVFELDAGEQQVSVWLE